MSDALILVSLFLQFPEITFFQNETRYVVKINSENVSSR